MILNWILRLRRTTKSKNTSDYFATQGVRFEDILAAPGKASRAALARIALSLSKDEFVNLVHCPFLVGSAIQDGKLAAPVGKSRDILAAKTFMFTSAQVDELVTGGAIDQSIFVLRKDTQGQSGASIGHFSIGRSKENDLRIVDFAISRHHATIEVIGNKYVVKDADSRNGTKVNGYSVGAKGSYVKDGDILRLGRYEFSFYLPGTLYDKITAPSNGASR